MRLRTFGLARTSRLAPTLQRSFAAASDPGAVKVDLAGAFKIHGGAVGFDRMPTEAYTTKEELLDYFELMHRMRRMEISCDIEYKSRMIRGFCHLYDGQEAVATGIEAAFTREDSWITSYRCHCIALARGGTVKGVLSELFGFKEGMTQGKGGSMHFYNKKQNFYGGQGIVGAQVPVGAGLAFASKYNSNPGEPMPVAIACYGDGAANQGQVWESANMAALWNLPLILCIENNQYGMGTSMKRHSSAPAYYSMGNHIPGMKIFGNNVLAVREGMKVIKDYCGAGNGPFYVEMDTYRYHGHSMSDPGKVYRGDDEVKFQRTERDPIKYVKTLLLEHSMMSEAELKDIEKRIREEVKQAVDEAKKGSFPPLEDLFQNVYMDSKGDVEYPPVIRMPDRANNRIYSK